MADNRLSELSSRYAPALQFQLNELFEGGFDIATIWFSTADLGFAVVN